MQYLQTIRLILSLLPLILTAVKAIEEALPEGGQGAAKLALIRQTIEAGYGIANDVVVSFTNAWPAIEKTVAAVVGLYNTAGAFKK